jgi:hypothetical protein
MILHRSGRGRPAQPPQDLLRQVSGLVADL